MTSLKYSKCPALSLSQQPLQLLSASSWLSCFKAALFRHFRFERQRKKNNKVLALSLHFSAAEAAPLNITLVGYLGITAEQTAGKKQPSKIKRLASLQVYVNILKCKLLNAKIMTHIVSGDNYQPCVTSIIFRFISH